MKKITLFLSVLRKTDYLKFTEALQDTPDLTNFIKKAVDNLDKHINLFDYDLVVMPESSSKVNQYMLRYIYRFAQPTLRKMGGMCPPGL